MLPDGTLVLCCQDYGMKHILGNLLHDSWQDIQKGYAYQYFKRGLKDGSCDILCRKCADAKRVTELPAMRIKQLVSEKKKCLNAMQEADCNANDIMTI